ncbi:MAG TPA: VOC family protein [Mucilaginibacter sp.]|jgi:uncharacterized glyoxalase superfamily protein PhnB
MTAPQYAATIFHVSYVERSIEYYTGVLGFTVDFRYGDLAGMVFGNVLIYLSGPAQGVKRAIGEGSIYIFCDDVNEYYLNIKSMGADISVDIEDRAYGMRDFGIADPDGNFLTFGMEMIS